LFDTASASVLTHSIEAPLVETGLHYMFAISAYNEIHESETSPLLMVIAGTEPA
jgi:hypothetical protein